METVSLAQLRQYVVAHQRYASRFRRSSTQDVEDEIRRLSAVQLDSITAVERAHRLTLTARIGAYPAGSISELLAGGRVFEYWAHEASLLPIELYPLYRPVMAGPGHWRSHERALREHADLVPHVLGAIRERGPLGARDFSGAGGGMWDWKPEKMILEALWDHGALAIAGRPRFQRLYDLTERVIPAEVRDAPVPEEPERLRALIRLAVRARGALTNAGIREHWRLKGGAARLRDPLAALVAEGAIREVAVDDGGPPVYVGSDAEVDGAPRGGVLVGPFDNLLWERPFVERLFGFRHVIEVYKREHEREYGYYVLPFLLDDRLVGRADLKAERKESLLRVKAFHLEPGVRRTARLESELDKALARLARTIGLVRVVR